MLFVSGSRSRLHSYHAILAVSNRLCRVQQRAVSTSTFELFKIGVGPSSSHTVGPMKACNSFLEELGANGLDRTERVKVELFGSLALTGKGHATDQACFLGLTGIPPDCVENAEDILNNISKTGTLELGGGVAAARIAAHASGAGDDEIPDVPTALSVKKIMFDEKTDVVWNFDRLPEHSNAMRLTALDDAGVEVFTNTYFSIGGGFIRTQEEMNASTAEIHAEKHEKQLDWHFSTMDQLLKICKEKNIPIKEVMRHNERAKGYSDEAIDRQLDRIWGVMSACITRGLNSTEEHLPGSLKVKRRAPALNSREKSFRRSNSLNTMDQPYLPILNSMSKLSMYAIAVNEENAGGWSQIVTAPTNGASGVIPACMQYMVVDLLHPRFVKASLGHLYENANVARVQAPRDFLLTAAAIGALIKQNSSISGAEAGCMGEVGSASSMAAAGLTAALGGTPEQVENAAEIAMEHSLGLTCDPIDGLVQVPCIERNAMGATKAFNATTLALMDNASDHTVHFDTVIEVMKKIGEDMKMEYKETALGGLALAAKVKRSLPEC